MTAKWMTLPEIASDRHITIDEAQRLVDWRHCARVYEAKTTYFLIC